MTDLDIVIKALRAESDKYMKGADESEGDAVIARMIFKVTGAALRDVATRISNEQKLATPLGGWQMMGDL